MMAKLSFVALAAAWLTASAADVAPGTCAGQGCDGLEKEGVSSPSLLQAKRAVKSDKPLSLAEDASFSSDAKVINGVPVYGYHQAKLAGTPPDQQRVALVQDSDQAAWNVWFQEVTDAQLAEFCAGITSTGAVCDGREQGHPDEHGLKWEVVIATQSQIEEILAMTWDFTLNFIEHDEPVHMVEPEPAIESLLQEGVESNPPWGLDRIDEGGMDGSYTSPGNQGSGVHVYVLDTGVRTTHDDFEGRAIPTLESIGSGQVACAASDTSCAGDHHGHGTHCAGTVGGKMYGVAKQATLHAVKVLNPSGYTSWITGAMDWVLSSGEKPAVISMSLGGPGTSSAYSTAITSAVQEGVVVVVAAGNSNSDACQFSPAFAPDAITVGSSTSYDSMSSFSNYGSCVDIFAPGSSIKSAGKSSDTSTATMSGTSMACPHVAGAAAVLLSDDPDMDAQEVTSELVSAATSGAISSLPANTVNKLLHVTAGPSPAPEPAPGPAPGATEVGEFSSYGHDYKVFEVN